MRAFAKRLSPNENKLAAHRCVKSTDKVNAGHTAEHLLDTAEHLRLHANSAILKLTHGVVERYRKGIGLSSRAGHCRWLSLSCSIAVCENDGLPSGKRLTKHGAGYTGINKRKQKRPT